jgi:hypothetical protein
MQKTFLLFLLFICAGQLKAQYVNQTANPDSIITVRHYRRSDYYQMNYQAISKDYLLSRLNKFQSSANELSRSKIHLTLSFLFLGAFAMAYIVPNPTSILFSIIGVPSCLIESAIARKHFRKSIHLYNNEMSKLQTQQTS